MGQPASLTTSRPEAPVRSTGIKQVSTLGKSSPAEIRQEKKRPHDFVCESCGEEWDTPGHMFWLSRDYCPQCGEVVEAK